MLEPLNSKRRMTAELNRFHWLRNEFKCSAERTDLSRQGCDLQLCLGRDRQSSQVGRYAESLLYEAFRREPCLECDQEVVNPTICGNPEFFDA